MNELKNSAPKRASKAPVGYLASFLRIWMLWPQSKRTGKAEAYAAFLARLKESNLTEEILCRCAELYIAECVSKQTEAIYYLMPASFFGSKKRRFEDYLDRASSRVEDEPDWWQPAGKLIRDMSVYERSKFGVPNPLPARLDYGKNFGK